MLGVRCQSYPDLRGILDFYKSELESENKTYIFEALRRYGVVSKVVGKDNSEFCLLPLILNVVEFGNYEVNHIVSEELVNIIDVNINYTKESKEIIKKICSKLLFNEEISIRIESIKSLEAIFSRFVSSELVTSFIEEVILPIVKEKCSSKDSITNLPLTDKLSFCNIIPNLILPYCNKTEKNNLVLLYLSLCDDEVPSLRIGASQNLVQILKKIFPLKCGMSLAEYSDIKLVDQSIITEKLLNLVLSLSNDQTSCEVLKSTSVGIAIHLYTNPLFYLEYISSYDRNQLLYFVCEFLDSKYHLQRNAIIGELLPMCLSIRDYYKLSENDSNFIFRSYLSSNEESLLSNIAISSKNSDLMQCIFNILANENETETKILVLEFFQKLIVLGIETYEGNNDSYQNDNIVMKRNASIVVDLSNSIISYIYEHLSEFQLEIHVSLKNSLCTLIVHLIKYIEYLPSGTSYFGIDIKNIKIKFIQVFVSYFTDSNTNVVINAIEHLHVIINQINEEYIFCYLLPQIKTLIFSENEIISFNKKQTEKNIAVQNWRIKRCIIRQLPHWTKSIVFDRKICEFFNCIIIRCILDSTLTVSISALQTIMDIISGFETFDECVYWTNNFIIPSIFIPYIESKSHSIELSCDTSDSNKNSDGTESPLVKDRNEVFDYNILGDDYNKRILVLNIIFVTFRSLFYKWAFINFENLQENLVNREKDNKIVREDETEESSGLIILTDVLNQEEVFTRLSKLVAPIIYNCITDPIVNVSISASKLSLQIIKLFSIKVNSIHKQSFETSNFAGRTEFLNSCEDELLKNHLINQFELDSIWHLRSVMSNIKIELQEITHFPICIYREFKTIFDKYSEIEVDESEEELYRVVNSIKLWYNLLITNRDKPFTKKNVDRK
ncbi:hypothetical protein FG379_003026 [Cryptosporidium bovis]|uniref:uncharacterized protein n=1 Tax=Cryptosporidium bovis TaxID=310047 RepID=UPI00351A2746|nr:hypothetical protein FG379_003026 [Cryptosporidium bovis]